MKKQGVMLEKKETIAEGKLCKRGYTETTNYAEHVIWVRFPIESSPYKSLIDGKCEFSQEICAFL